MIESTPYSLLTQNLEEGPFRYRAYEGLLYVSKPVDLRFQTLNLYIPEVYFEGGQIGPYQAESAPIFLPNTIGGYMPGRAGRPGLRPDGKPDAALTALSRGCIVAAPGARGRTCTNEAGTYTGKAPAAIVDLKAAVRFLRAHGEKLPGNTERIISNGTSAGGALSLLLGATGNAPEYEPYLDALGAANARDDIFAVSAFCPVTDLDHADMAYEWLFAEHSSCPERFGPRPGHGPGQRPEPSFPWSSFQGGPGPGHEQRTPTMRSLSDQEIKHARALKALFPGHLNSLGLKAENGEPLVLNPDGEGTFKDHLRTLLIDSAQEALDAGTDLSGTPWLRIAGGKVADLDFDAYIHASIRRKAPLAFDALDLHTPENGLFGSPSIDARHFTDFVAKLGGPTLPVLAEAEQVRLMNPMYFLTGKGVAKHWRIRHGTADHGSSLATAAIITAALRGQGASVDLKLPWDLGHAGDYDLPSLFSWIETTCL